MKRLRASPRITRLSVSNEIQHWASDLQFQSSLVNMANCNVSHLDEVQAR